MPIVMLVTPGKNFFFEDVIATSRIVIPGMSQMTKNNNSLSIIKDNTTYEDWGLNLQHSSLAVNHAAKCQ